MADFLQNLRQQAQQARVDAQRQANEARLKLQAQQAQQRAEVATQQRKEQSKLDAERQRRIKESAAELEKARRRRLLPFRRQKELAEAETRLSEARKSPDIQEQSTALAKRVETENTKIDTAAQTAIKSINEQESKANTDIVTWEKGEEDKFKEANIFIEPKEYKVPTGETGTVGIGGTAKGTEFSRATREGVFLKTIGGWVDRKWYDSLPQELKTEVKNRGIDNFNLWAKNPGIMPPWEFRLEKSDPYLYLYQGVGVQGIPVDQPQLTVRNERTVKLLSDIGKVPTITVQSPNISAVNISKNEIVAVIDGIQYNQDEFKQNFIKQGGSWWRKEDWSNMPVDAQMIVRQDGYEGLQREKARLYKTLPDGKQIWRTDLESMPSLMRKDVEARGMAALQVLEKGKPINQFMQLQDWGVIDKESKFGGMDEEGNFLIDQDDLIDYVFNNVEESLTTPVARQEFKEGLKERGIGTPEFWKGVGIGLIPVAGTIYHWRVMKPWARGLSTALDVATFIPFLNIWSAGVRAAAVPGRSMLKATTIGFGRAVLAEVKAPITAIRHPIKTAETVLYPIETVIKPKKIPLTSAEIRPNTVKLPVREIGDATSAKQARDILFDLQTEGRGANIVKDGQEIGLTPTVMNTLGTPAAVHATPDIRPFLHGSVIQQGKEGGLFLSPTLHSRFSSSSAFGVVAEDVGSMPGGLIIRDEKILSQLVSSNKIYRGTAEVEAILPAGTKLPEPSQIITTRDVSGQKLYLAVIGKKFSASELLKMKIMGSVDVVKDIFRPAVKIKGGTLTKYDELMDFGDDYRKLEKELEVAKKAGRTDEAAKIKSEMMSIDTRAKEVARAIDREAAGRTALRGLFVSKGEYIDTRTYRELARTDPERLSRYIRGLTEENQRRVMSRLEPNQRPKITQTIERLRTEPTRREIPARARVETPRRAVSADRPVTRVTRRVGERPPTRVTRIPTRRPARVPRRVPGRVPPAAPPIPPPLIPPLPLPQSESELTKEQREGAVTWRQGIFYIVIYPPYGDKNRFYTKIKPRQVREAKGIRSAYKSIARFRGPVKKTIKFDMGIVDVTVSPNKEEDTPVLEFKPDKEQMMKPHKKKRTVKQKKTAVSRII